MSQTISSLRNTIWHYKNYLNNMREDLAMNENHLYNLCAQLQKLEELAELKPIPTIICKNIIT